MTEILFGLQQTLLFDINMLLMIYNSNNGMNMSLLNACLFDRYCIDKSDYVANFSTSHTLGFPSLLLAITLFFILDPLGSVSTWLTAIGLVQALFSSLFRSLCHNRFLLFAQNRKLGISLTCNLQLEWVFEVFMCTLLHFCLCRSANSIWKHYVMSRSLTTFFYPGIRRYY